MAFSDEDKAWISSTMVGLLGPIRSRLDAIDNRLIGTDARLDAIETRLDGIHTRLDGMDTRFDGIDVRLDRMDTRFDVIDDRLIATNDRLDASTAHLSSYLLEMRSETTHRFDAVEQRLDFMANTLLNVQPLTKAMVDMGSLMSQLTRGQQQSTDRHFDLENRIARLEDQVSRLINRAA